MPLALPPLLRLVKLRFLFLDILSAQLGIPNFIRDLNKFLGKKYIFLMKLPGS